MASALFRPLATNAARQLAYIALVLACAIYAPTLEIALAALLALLLMAFETRSPVRELGLGAPPNWRWTLVVGIAGGVILLLFGKLVLTPLVEALTGVRRDMSRLEFLRGDLRAYLSFLPLIWISAALCEEIVFRGFLITRLRALFGLQARYSTAAAVVLSSIAFAWVHAYQGITGIIVTGTMSLLLGALFVAARFNLWCNVLLHGTYDTVSLGMVCMGWDTLFTS